MADNPEISENEDVTCPLNCCQTTKCDTIWKAISPINLMVFMFIFGFSLSVQFNLRENLIYKQICKDRLHDDYTSCYKLKKEGNVADIHQKVLDAIKTSSTHVFLMIGLKILLQSVSSFILCSWSDSCGRKFPLLIALVGEIFECTSFFFKDAPFVYFIWGQYIMTGLSGLFGSYVCITAMCYCYLTDSYASETRALTFTMVDFAHMLGSIGGVVVFKRWIFSNKITISFLSLLCVRCGLIVWSQLFFPEKDFELNGETVLEKIYRLTSTNHVRKMLITVTKWRPYCQNEELRLLTVSAIPVMITYSLIEGVILSSRNHALLFQSFPDYDDITLYFAVYSCFGQVLVIIVYSCLSVIKDSTLGIVGFCSLYLNEYISAFASDYLTFLVGLGLGPLKTCAAVGLRSAFSKIPEEDERGKLFFFFALSEISSQFFGYLLYYKLHQILTPREDILPHMITGLALILTLCTFTFQMITTQINNLCDNFFRNIRIHELQSIQTIPEEN